MQLCTGGISLALLLHGRVYEGRVMMPVIAPAVIHADTFRKDGLYSLFTYPFAEMDGFGGVARKE